MYSLWHYHCLSPAVIITQQVGLLHCLMGTSPVIHPMTSVLCTSLVSHIQSPLKSLLGTLINLCVVHYELALVKVAELLNSQETVHCFLSYPICV